MTAYVDFWMTNLRVEQYLGAESLDPQASLARTIARAEECDRILREFIVRRIGTAPQSEMVSLPHDLKHLGGDTRLVKYDRQADRYSVGD